MPLYHAYGLTVETDAPIQGLSSLDGSRTPDVRVRHAALPEGPVPEPQWPEGARHEEGIYFAGPSTGVYRVGGPDRITCDPDPSVDPKHTMEPVLGILLGTVLHLRGVCTLHASAVVMDPSSLGMQYPENGAVAFVGRKRQGKSTTAAAFQQAGHRVLTDDVLALRGLPDSTLRASHSFSRLKLTHEAAGRLGYSWEQLTELSTSRKRAWTNEEGFCREAAPLAAIFSLEEGDSVECKRLGERDGALTILQHSYAPRFLGNEGTGADHFHQCNNLARRVPVYRLRRPRRFEAFPELIETVQKRMAPSAIS